MKHADMIPGEIYEIRCSKCDWPSNYGRCVHSVKALEHCQCCNNCRDSCLETCVDMFMMSKPCEELYMDLEDELTEALKEIKV